MQNEQPRETVDRILAQLPALVMLVRKENVDVMGLPCTCDTPELHQTGCLLIRTLIHKLDAMLKNV